MIEKRKTRKTRKKRRERKGDRPVVAEALVGVEAPAWLRAWAGIKMEAKEGLLDNSVRDGETDRERERDRERQRERERNESDV